MLLWASYEEIRQKTGILLKVIGLAVLGSPDTWLLRKRWGSPPCQNIYRKTKPTEERLNDNWAEAGGLNRREIENIESKEDCEVWQEGERAIGPSELPEKIWTRQADSQCLWSTP
jgi:hypothetical protein